MLVHQRVVVLWWMFPCFLLSRTLMLVNFPEFFWLILLLVDVFGISILALGEIPMGIFANSSFCINISPVFCRSILHPSNFFIFVPSKSAVGGQKSATSLEVTGKQRKTTHQMGCFSEICCESQNRDFGQHFFRFQWFQHLFFFLKNLAGLQKKTPNICSWHCPDSARPKGQLLATLYELASQQWHHRCETSPNKILWNFAGETNHLYIYTGTNCEHFPSFFWQKSPWFPGILAVSSEVCTWERCSGRPAGNLSYHANHHPKRVWGQQVRGTCFRAFSRFF